MLAGRIVGEGSCQAWRLKARRPSPCRCLLRSTWPWASRRRWRQRRTSRRGDWGARPSPRLVGARLEPGTAQYRSGIDAGTLGHSTFVSPCRTVLRMSRTNKRSLAKAPRRPTTVRHVAQIGARNLPFSGENNGAQRVAAHPHPPVSNVSAQTASSSSALPLASRRSSVFASTTVSSAASSSAHRRCVYGRPHDLRV